MLKKIDKLLILSFIPPLVLWSLVAMFVFNMQFLWKYIDEIVGKDLEIWVIFELLFYQALAMIPRSLVFGVVIASVMTMGNLAEHYELVAMKSAGISLARILRPLLIIAMGLGIFSFIFSNNLIPVASLKFKARLYDIRRQKPALNLAAGQFNRDFRNVVIYIGEKDKKGNQLKDVKIYDHSNGMGGNNQTNAQKGELFYTEDKRYLVLRLEKGERQEDMPATGQQVHTYPFLRMSFSSFTTMYDMQEFDATKTDEKLFSKHYSLLSTHQLIKALDSLDQQLYRVSEDLQRSSDNFYHFRRKLYTDSSLLASQGKNYFWVEGQPTPQGEKNVSIWEGTPAEKRDYLKTRAMNSLRTLRDQAVNMQSSIKRYRQSAAEHENEIHQKFLYAIACLLFLVIGAPMGAIIRKGGFGYPILVAFIFFMVFFVLNLSGEQLVKGLTVSPWLGGWLPAIVLFPLALVLLQKAKNDEHLLDFSTWTRQWQRWKGRWLKKS